MAVAKIDSDVLTGENGLPAPGGLHDPRLGPTDRGSRCAECYGDYFTCPGHFGYIELAQPVYNMGYIHTILSVLKCVCYKCGRLLISKVYLFN